MLVSIKSKLDVFCKNIKNDKIWVLIIIGFIILTIPRSIDEIFPKVYDIINIFKIIIVILMLGLIILKKIKLNSLTKNVIIYSIYLFIITLINKVTPITFLKVYLLNIGMLLFCEVLFKSNYKERFVKFFSNYFLIILIANLIGICIGFIQGNTNGYLLKTVETYILGQDNRFILYIIPTLIGFYYSHNKRKIKSDKIKMYITFLVGVVSLAIIWSASALCVVIMLGLAYIIFKNQKKIRINIYVISIILFAISIGIVFFKMQNIFKFLVVDILHKSLDLSYRTILWDDAILMLKNSPINLIFGFGYFDTMNTFTNMPIRVGHLHNIVMNNLFFAGIIGSIIYYYKFYLIERNIHKLKNIKHSNILSIMFLSILVLMLFDTFELYQIYYFILFILYEGSVFLNEREETKIKEIENQDSKVAIMLATYNGEKYIEKQIDSIINQTYKNWVIYVSDDHSTDNTMQIIESYKEKLGDRLIIIENNSKFSSAKLNFANLFAKVNGSDYYTFCDQDDEWDEKKLNNLLVTIKEEEKKKKGPILVYCDSKIVDSNMKTIANSLVEYSNKHLPEKNIMKHVLLENYFPGCAVLFNKELKNKTNKIYEECEMHDWWLTLTGALTGKIIFLDEPLHYYKQHGGNTVGAHKDENIIKKIIVRVKKIFNLKDTKTTWKKYQGTVLKQAQELYKEFSQDKNIDKKQIEDVKTFAYIMQNKNKFKRLILLIKHNYLPIDKIRVLRLIL